MNAPYHIAPIGREFGWTVLDSRTGEPVMDEPIQPKQIALGIAAAMNLAWERERTLSIRQVRDSLRCPEHNAFLPCTCKDEETGGPCKYAYRAGDAAREFLAIAKGETA